MINVYQYDRQRSADELVERQNNEAILLKMKHNCNLNNHHIVRRDKLARKFNAKVKSFVEDVK